MFSVSDTFDLVKLCVEFSVQEWDDHIRRSDETTVHIYTEESIQDANVVSLLFCFTSYTQH